MRVNKQKNRSSNLRTGANSEVVAMMATPTLLIMCTNSASCMLVRNPGMLSSLSKVPPVNPRPRPDILLNVRLKLLMLVVCGRSWQWARCGSLVASQVRANSYMGTTIPRAQTIGAKMRETLSPTPPDECLSTLGFEIDERSATMPLAIMAWVRSAISRLLMPLSCKHIKTIR